MNVILMCGGLSKRFLDEENNNVCKIIYNISGKPMIIHILNTIQKLDPNNKIIIVLSNKYGNLIVECIDKYIENTKNIVYTYQDVNKNGTAGAIISCLNYLEKSEYENTLILSGDVPYISVETIKKLLEYKNCIMITKLKNPYGNGRIIFGKNNNVIEVIEEKDCDYLQKNIEYINTGNYYLETKNIINSILSIQNNNKANEYYLTDIVKILYNKNINLSYHDLPEEKHYEIYNINTLKDLKDAEKLYKNNI